jgi:hypothetical protein
MPPRPTRTPRRPLNLFLGAADITILGNCISSFTAAPPGEHTPLGGVAGFAIRPVEAIRRAIASTVFARPVPPQELLEELFACLQ